MHEHLSNLGGFIALSEYSSLSTFSCLHKVTKRPICVVPCNGINEMCENDIDEQCEGPGLHIVILSTSAFVIIFVLSAFITGQRHSVTTKSRNLNELLRMTRYESGKKEEELFTFQRRLLTYRDNYDYKSAICQEMGNELSAFQCKPVV